MGLYAKLTPHDFIRKLKAGEYVSRTGANRALGKCTNFNRNTKRQLARLVNRNTAWAGHRPKGALKMARKMSQEDLQRKLKEGGYPTRQSAQRGVTSWCVANGFTKTHSTHKKLTQLLEERYSNKGPLEEMEEPNSDNVFVASMWSEWSYEGTPIKVGTKEGHVPVFLVKNIAECLGLNTVNLSQLVAPVPPEHKGRCQVLTPGGPQKMLCVTEPGLYWIVMRSDSPKAESLRLFVCEEVLPALRTKGTFSVQQPPTAGDSDINARLDQFEVRMEKLTDNVGKLIETVGMLAQSVALTVQSAAHQRETPLQLPGRIVVGTVHADNLGPGEYTVDGALRKIGYSNFDAGDLASVGKLFANIRGRTMLGRPRLAKYEGEPLAFDLNGHENWVNKAVLPADLPVLCAAITTSMHNGKFAETLFDQSAFDMAVNQWRIAARSNPLLLIVAGEVNHHLGTDPNRVKKRINWRWAL